MYDLPHVKAEADAILPFLEKYPFAVLCAADKTNHSVEATHLPLLVENEEGIIKIFGHIMKDCRHHLCFQQAGEVLAIFNGPDHYISSAWYPGKVSASTWNYMTVHVRGKIRFVGEDELRIMLQKLTDRFEGKDSPRRYSYLPSTYINDLLPYIAGFYIDIIKIESVFKLSQRENEEVYRSIIEKLEKEDDCDARELAEEMKKRIPDLFSK